MSRFSATHFPWRFLLRYPRLSHASSPERKRWRRAGRGAGIHWEDLDEDISVENLLAGKPSDESQASFSKWLARRVVANAKALQDVSPKSTRYGVEES